MKLASRRRAIELLRRHPGWGDRRIAREVGVAPSTIGRWRRAEGLAPAVRWVGKRKGPREQLVEPGFARPRLGQPTPDPLSALGLARPRQIG